MHHAAITPNAAFRALYFFCVSQLLLWAWLRGQGYVQFAIIWLGGAVVAIIVFRALHSLSIGISPLEPSWDVLRGHYLIGWSFWMLIVIARPFVLRAITHYPEPVTETIVDSLFQPQIPWAAILTIESLHRRIKVARWGGLFNRDK